MLMRSSKAGKALWALQMMLVTNWREALIILWMKEEHSAQTGSISFQMWNNKTSVAAEQHIPKQALLFPTHPRAGLHSRLRWWRCDWRRCSFPGSDTLLHTGSRQSNSACSPASRLPLHNKVSVVIQHLWPGWLSLFGSDPHLCARWDRTLRPLWCWPLPGSLQGVSQTAGKQHWNQERTIKARKRAPGQLMKTWPQSSCKKNQNNLGVTMKRENHCSDFFKHPAGWFPCWLFPNWGVFDDLVFS